MLEFISQPWPWYIAGPLIGLIVPTLLILGNKSFGISSSFRHVCAACFPADIEFFKYDWKNEIWNLLFVLGIMIGGYIAFNFLNNGAEIVLADQLKTSLATYGINDYSNGLLPTQIMSWDNLATLKGFVLIVVGGFLVGFGTRYAGGCTSGHAIMGISSLNWSSVVATICFMLGGFFAANIILPYILSL